WPGSAEITADMVQRGRDDILEQFYQEKTADLGAPVRILIEDRLLTVDDRRDTVALANALAIPGVTAEAIRKLVDRRLLRREERGWRASARPAGGSCRWSACSRSS